MNKKMIFYLKISLTLLVISMFSACGDEEETKNPYYGKWESRAYPSLSLQGAPIFEKMEFDFTNTAFEDKVYQGVTADALQLALGIKGSVVYTEPSTLAVEVNEISLQGAPYVSKETDPTAFATSFGATMGQRLHETFTATYAFSNDTLIMTLPMINPAGGDDIPTPLRLTKVE